MGKGRVSCAKADVLKKGEGLTGLFSVGVSNGKGMGAWVMPSCGYETTVFIIDASLLLVGMRDRVSIHSTSYSSIHISIAWHLHAFLYHQVVTFIR